MTNPVEPQSEQFTSEGMPTIPLRPMQVTTTTNRVYGVCLAVIVFFIAVNHDVLLQGTRDFVVPQLVFILGLGVLVFVLAVVRRWYWLCVGALAMLGTAIATPWVATIGGAVVGISVGVTFLLIYAVARVLFDRNETWPFLMSAIATVYAGLSLAAHSNLLPEWLVLPILLIGIAILFVRQLRIQQVL